jgi:hypothetical protein
MTRRIRVFLPICALIALLGLFIHLLLKQMDGGDTDGLDGEMPPAEQAGEDGGLLSGASAKLFAQAPLRERLPALRARIDAGDANARCKLAMEYVRCENIADFLADFMTRIEQDSKLVQTLPADHPDKAEAVRRLAKYDAGLERAQRLAQQCSGVTLPSASELIRLVRESAEAGNLRATEVYVSGAMFEGVKPEDATEEIRRFREGAEAMALSAAARGSIPAASALASAYFIGPHDPTATTLSNVARKDPVASLSLFYAIRDTVDAHSDNATSRMVSSHADAYIRRLESEMSPAEVAAARAKRFVIARSGSEESVREATALIFAPARKYLKVKVCD